MLTPTAWELGRKRAEALLPCCLALLFHLKPKRVIIALLCVSSRGLPTLLPRHSCLKGKSISVHLGEGFTSNLHVSWMRPNLLFVHSFGDNSIKTSTGNPKSRHIDTILLLSYCSYRALSAIEPKKPVYVFSHPLDLWDSTYDDKIITKKVFFFPWRNDNEGVTHQAPNNPGKMRSRASWNITHGIEGKQDCTEVKQMVKTLNALLSS